MSGNSYDEQLKTAFNFAAKTFPEVTANATPVGMGHFGIVLSHDDDTLTKIAFRPEKEDFRTRAELFFKNDGLNGSFWPYPLACA